jgi:hypothetical protein
MAEKIVFQYFDDLDGEPLDVEDLHAVEWSWKGVDYHFDTSTDNYIEIEAGHISVATLLAKSVRTERQPTASTKRPPTAEACVDNNPALDLAHSREVRTWAVANHHLAVGKRGRLSNTVVEAYNRAH